MNTKIQQLTTRIRWVLAFFMVSLIISGATAIPVEGELDWYLQHFERNTELGKIFMVVLNAVRQTRIFYPFLMYGYDWLAFAHFVIAVGFIGPFKNPVKNIWVIEFGMIACIMVIPFALIFSAIRGLPFWWSLIDCSFGVIGILPLWYCRQKIKQLEILTTGLGQNIIF
jgi:hypothetical protein